MAKVRVSKTAHGNVKIILDNTSAEKLAKIINWSSAIGVSSPEDDSSSARAECARADVEDMAWELHDALKNAGVHHAHL